MAIAKNPKVIMNEKQFVERLLNIKNRKTFYKNKYPFNLCYINNDGRTSADCVNLVKAILNGYNVYNNTKGYYQRDLSNTGDCTEAELLAQCEDVSQDFTTLGVHPEILYMKGHIGTYIGKEVDGKYNVIECTPAFGNGVVYSWVDADGTRRNEKNGYKTKKWTHHGKPSKWVDMHVYGWNPEPMPAPISNDNKVKNDANNVEPLKSNSDEVWYNVKAGDTLSRIAAKNKTTVDAILKLNPKITNPNLIYAGARIRIK